MYIAPWCAILPQIYSLLWKHFGQTPLVLYIGGFEFVKQSDRWWVLAYLPFHCQFFAGPCSVEQGFPKTGSRPTGGSHRILIGSPCATNLIVFICSTYFVHTGVLPFLPIGTRCSCPLKFSLNLSGLIYVKWSGCATSKRFNNCWADTNKWACFWYGLYCKYALIIIIRCYRLNSVCCTNDMKKLEPVN